MFFAPKELREKNDRGHAVCYTMCAHRYTDIQTHGRDPEKGPLGKGDFLVNHLKARDISEDCRDWAPLNGGERNGGHATFVWQERAQTGADRRHANDTGIPENHYCCCDKIKVHCVIGASIVRKVWVSIKFLSAKFGFTPPPPKRPKMRKNSTN